MEKYSYEINVTPDLLMESLQTNREIEFILDGRLFFAQPCANHPDALHYTVWDVDTHICIFDDDIKALFAFHFPNGKTLLSDFGSFEFLYIY